MRLPTRIAPHRADQIDVVGLRADDRLAGHVGEIDEVGSGRRFPPCERLVNGRDDLHILCCRLGRLYVGHQQLPLGVTRLGQLYLVAYPRRLPFLAEARLGIVRRTDLLGPRRKVDDRAL